MMLPRFIRVEQRFPNRALADVAGRIRDELRASGLMSKASPGVRIAIGVGSRGISNIALIVRTVADSWKEAGAKPFIFPAMGSHGAATAEGQADVLAHYGIDEASMGVPIISSLDVVSTGRTPDGIETFLARDAFESDGVFLVGRVKWHTDFSGDIESGIFKMMAIGVGKFAGARQYHTFGYRLGMERVIRSAGAQVHASGKILGGLAIQEGAHHETAGVSVISALEGADAMLQREEQLLREVKSWAARLPAPEIDVLIVDEIGKDISGAGMDTKVINRSIHGHYNPFPELPIVHRVYARALSANTYHSGVGIGLADVIHDRLLADIDWNPTYVNSLTASTPAAIRTPVHFASDRMCLEQIAATVGKADLSQITYCRIRNTLELASVYVSENLLPSLASDAHVASAPFDVSFNAAGDFADFPDLVRVGAEQTSNSTPEDGLTRRIGAYNDKLFLAEHRMEKGWTGAAHQHPHDQMAYVVSGHVRVRAGQEVFEARAGDSFVIRGGVEHQAWALEASVVIDVFTPLREDYL